MACMQEVSLLVLIEILFFVTIIDITNQTDCGTQELIWYENADNLTKNWQIEDAGQFGVSFPYNCQPNCTNDNYVDYYVVYSYDYDPAVATPYFFTNQGVITTVPYFDITIHYAIYQGANFVTDYSVYGPSENAQCGTSYSVDNGMSWTPIDIQTAVIAEQWKWKVISGTLGTDASNSNNIQIRWEFTSFETNINSTWYLAHGCQIDEIKLCGTRYVTLPPTLSSNSPTSSTLVPSATPTRPTSSPSKAPTESGIVPCIKGVTGYSIDGIPAFVSGFSHFRTWNGNKHDFMGIGNHNQQFYYMHPCKGTTRRQM
eukprot:131627_1